MARSPRLVIPGQPLHMIQRGNNRSMSFVATDDYLYYKTALRQASKRARCAIHAYVLMSNHVHLLVTPEDDGGPSRMMQAVGRRYVRYFNDRYARTGTLWEGRFRSALIDSHRYFFACSRYIETNPVRARITKLPALYPWSSFRYNANGEPDSLLTPHALYAGLGARAEERRGAYRALFDGNPGAEALDVIRHATNAGAVLGTERFRAQIEEALHRRLERLPHGGDRRSPVFQSARDADQRL
jgi:putative transposase